MNQQTHTWIAIRAIALLQDEGKEENLVKLLKPHTKMASVGAWIPDQIDAKRGGAGSATENHILKFEPYKGKQKTRFTVEKADLLKKLGMHREIAVYLKNDSKLGAKWWDKPYRGDVTKPGNHLPNRAMALTTMQKDMLLLGNRKIDSLLPGIVGFTRYMDPDTRTEEEAAAMYYFMLSHFIADASMPCHCDARRLAGYSRGLHKEMEVHWSRKVGSYFKKSKLLQDNKKLTAPQAKKVLDKARSVDSKFGLSFKNKVPGLRPKQDVWLELIHVCRASFALASIIAPPKDYKYDDKQARAPFNTVLGTGNPQLQAEVDRIVMHDAVMNTATIWKYIWNKVSKE